MRASIDEKWYKEADKRLRYNENSGWLIWRDGVRKGERAGSIRTTAKHGFRQDWSLHISINNESKSIGANRVIWYILHKELPETVDHIDRNPFNNKADNLRAATYIQNGQNGTLKKGKTTPRGIQKRPNGRYRARIRVNKKLIVLGQGTYEEALELRKAAELKYFGEYAPI